MPVENQSLKTLWVKRLEEWKSSGLSTKQWCRDNGIPKPTFYYWRHKLIPSNKPPAVKLHLASQHKFVELLDPEPTASGISIECRGLTVQLAKGFHPESLMSCLQILRSI
jgi:hypothetical protein